MDKMALHPTFGNFSTLQVVPSGSSGSLPVGKARLKRSTASMRSVASVVAPTHGDDPPVGVVRQHEVAVGSDREDGEEPPSRHRRSAGNDGNHRAP